MFSRPCEASMAITRDAEQDTHFDPSACVEVRRSLVDGRFLVDFVVGRWDFLDGIFLVGWIMLYRNGLGIGCLIFLDGMFLLFKCFLGRGLIFLGVAGSAIFFLGFCEYGFI